MKKWVLVRWWAGTVIALSGVLLTGCAPGTEVESPQEEGQVLDATNLEATLNAGGPGFRVSQNLMVIDPATLELMAPIEDGQVTAEGLDTLTDGVINFPGATENMIQLAQGDIVASGVTDKTPFGLLRKVTDVSVSDAGVEIATVQATLEDAIEEGEISIHEVLELPAQSSGIFRRGGGLMKVISAPNKGEINIQLEDVVLLDGDGDRINTKNDQVVANGSILVKPEYDFLVKISGIKLQKLDFENLTTIESSINIESGFDFIGVHPRIEIFAHTFKPRTIPTGSLPVVITPRFAVNLGLDGEVSVGVSTGVVHNAEMTIGAQYENGEWILSKKKTSTFDYIPPNVKTTSKARVYAAPRLELMIFGVVGPFGEVVGYFDLEMSPFDTHWWSLYGGIDAEIGVEFKIFKFLKEVSYVKRFTLLQRKLIDRAADVEPILSEEPSTLPTEKSEPPPISPTYTEEKPQAATEIPITHTPTRPPPETGGNVLLLYNEEQLTIINRSNTIISLEGISFERVSNQGTVTAAFEANIWNQVAVAERKINAFPAGDCYGLFVSSNYIRPPECASVWGYIQASATSRRQFWIPAAGSDSFLVIQNGNVIQQCAFESGSCSFTMP